MRTRAKVLSGVCLALLPLVAAPSCRSGGAAPPDAADGSLPPDETDGPSLPDASADSELPDGTVPEMRCGEGPNVYFSAHTVEQLATFSDCTVLVGRFQEDSVRELMDLAALQNVRRIEGSMNLFRSPGFVTLHGLEKLEEVDGNLFIHLNDNLTSIAALGRLRTVTGDLYIKGNPQLPQAEVDAIGAGITVGGAKALGPQVVGQ